MKNVLYLFISIYLISCVKSWDTEELEVFDVVEEVNQNFYELMGIPQDASAKDIKRAFRNLSIYLHPDKSDAEDANIQFRNLVSVYEVLKDPSKREKYDKVLKDGMPNWKSAVYYYRRVRKMGFAESAGILFLILTVGQYLVAWGVYIEKKYTAEQILGSKLKKLSKKNRANMDIDTIIGGIPSPSVYNTLPFQIVKGIWNFPKAVMSIFTMLSEYKRQEMEKKRLEAEEIERQKQIEEELAKEREAKKEKKENIRKRRQAMKAPEKTDEELAGYSQLKMRELAEDDMVRPVKNTKQQASGGLWTDEDLAELVRLVKKYPGGSTNRWEIIGDAMNRSVTEVTFMAAKLKENGYRISSQNDGVAENIIQEATEIKTKVKTKKTANPILVVETNWTQEQQRALEAAIIKYRKTGSGDRWQKIANSVPDKTKEECLIRYKYLVELVKSQKKGQKDKEDNTDEGSLEEEKNPDSDNCPIDENDIIENIDTISSTIVEEEEKAEEENVVKHTGGKPRNKRKERKKQQHFSSDEDYSD